MTPVIAPVPPHGSRFHGLLAQARPSPHSHTDHPLTPPRWLHSDFALQQLTRLALRCTEPEFVALMAPVFGVDITPSTYLKLHAALHAGLVANPDCQIVSTGAYPAEYVRSQRVIRIHAAALDHVHAHPDSSWELLDVLLHEFGHHLDVVLREDLAAGYVLRGDAAAEEGTLYARRMARAGWSGAQRVLLGSYSNAAGQPLSLYVQPRLALRRMIASRASLGSIAGDPFGSGREYFEATGDSDHGFSHERIAATLLSLGFSDFERQALFFGNWLRDYSQLLDPRLVRGPGMAKNFPQVFSRQALTEVVDILATRKFAEGRLQAPDTFKVTRERLGVYRPREHIDNPGSKPSATFDLAERDADFDPWVLEGDPLLDVDFATSMKRYIQHSSTFMQQELRAAMQLGRSPEGLRHFGSALHVLEDFFAHSNFVELGLIKLGHPVLPWTSRADCRHGLPLVTGRFGGADVIASLAQPIARLIAPVEDPRLISKEPGERSDTERMLLVLLAEHENSQWLERYQDWLTVRDTWRSTELSRDLARLKWIEMAPLKVLENAYNRFQRRMLELIGSSVDDLQTLQGGDPNSNGSTDPSHSQLAKDHAQHPLHAPAALAATQAVTAVANAMLEHWQNVPGADPAALAAGLFIHPNDSDWQDSLLRQWAADHPGKLAQAADLIELDQLQARVHTHAKESIEKLISESAGVVEQIIDVGQLLWKKLADRP